MENELASHMAATSVIDKVTLTDEEVAAYFQAHKAQFAAGAQVRAKHILVDSEDKAKKVEQEIASGSKSFEDAAKEYSSCPSKEKGGDLGFFGKGQMVPEFEKAAFEAEIGTLTGPVKTQFGYHLIRVEDKKEETPADFESIKGQLYENLLQQKKQAAYMEAIKELEKKYGVERKMA